jgi:TnpA family transposase
MTAATRRAQIRAAVRELKRAQGDMKYLEWCLRQPEMRRHRRELLNRIVKWKKNMREWSRELNRLSRGKRT